MAFTKKSLVIYCLPVCHWFCCLLEIQKRSGSIDNLVKTGHTCSLGCSSSRSNAILGLHQLVYQPSSSVWKTLLSTMTFTRSTVPVHSCLLSRLSGSSQPQFGYTCIELYSHIKTHTVRVIVKSGNLETLCSHYKSRHSLPLLISL